MNSLQTAKLWLIEGVGLARDALHIYVGLILLLGSAALFRWPLRGGKPWLAVLAAALIGEAWDMLDRLRLGLTQYPAGNWKDIWNTLFWPTALTLLARYTRLLKR
ncbi:hypothetical protein D1610_05305 [Sphingomonas gilva]|uniref:VanZ family protein n=1 Tax=Sphingomonas gilva TaxID=2305907 RepID=A0A396RN73_9SPHN|nr:hypothetical protein [Sphingomonas gilva]RHW17927.1 hypothetical protein D1610_05305 [Sphingomonas gilva]